MANGCWFYYQKVITTIDNSTIGNVLAINTDSVRLSLWKVCVIDDNIDTPSAITQDRIRVATTSHVRLLKALTFQTVFIDMYSRRTVFKKFFISQSMPLRKRKRIRNERWKIDAAYSGRGRWKKIGTT